MPHTQQLGFRALLLVGKSFGLGLAPKICSKEFLTGGIGREVIALAYSSRNISTSDSNSETASTTLLAQDILQQAQVKKLRDELEEESETNMHIPYTSFVERAKDSGAASTDTQAAALCDALQTTGILLKHNDMVYLRVDDILESVLPTGIYDARSKLAKIEEELAELEKHVGHVSGRAELVTNLLLGGGFIILFTQFLAFIYLTWWELSWDVMEPFGYIIQLFYSLVAYAYFLSTRGAVFDLAPFRDFWMGRISRSKMGQLNVDENRYTNLVKLRDRYRRHISHRSFRL
eukprot:gene30471-35482_t